MLDEERIGYLSDERLALLPQRHRAEHELCFYLHDRMVSMLQSAEEARASSVVHTFQDTAEVAQFEQVGDPISYFIDTGRRDLALRIALNQLNLALFADLLHHIFEALKALEKRKFVVALTLLRKPLQQNLLFATWMLADEEDFFQKLSSDPAKTMESKDLNSQRRKELFGKARRILRDVSFFDPEAVDSVLFDKNFAGGFACLFDKAIHLVTSRGSLMKTEVLNLNLIFKSPTDDDLYEHLYRHLAYLLMYLAFLQIELYSRMKPIERSYSDWIKLTALGAYEALFDDKQPLAKSLNRDLNQLLECPHCHSPVRIKRQGAARFFIRGELWCPCCRSAHQFPLFWLLSKTKWSLKPL